MLDRWKWLERCGWLANALAAGLLLQIAMQIRLLGWLPDFPIYLALALLAGIAAMVGVFTPFRSRPKVAALLALVFLAAAETHAALALNDSSAMERWRDRILWPTLVCGLGSCLMLGQRWPRSLLLIWTLGEATAAILGCWYAPSLGESPTLRANRYVLIAGGISLLGGIAVVGTGPRSSTAWQFLATLFISLLLLLVASLARPIPAEAQPLLMGQAALRFILLVSVANRWLQSDATKTGEEKPSPDAT